MSSSFFQQVAPKAGTPGVAVDNGPPAAPSGGSSGPPPSMITMLLPFLILVPFLLLSFRRQKKEQAQRSSLKKGDRVVTQSGLIGELIDMDEKIAKVKIAPGTTVQVLASSVSPFDPTVDKNGKKIPEPEPAMDDLKRAKAAADKK